MLLHYSKLEAACRETCARISLVFSLLFYMGEIYLDHYCSVNVTCCIGQVTAFLLFICVFYHVRQRPLHYPNALIQFMEHRVCLPYYLNASPDSRRATRAVLSKTCAPYLLIPHAAESRRISPSTHLKPFFLKYLVVTT